MPGNDRHGGFANYVTVPARYLCPVPEDVLAKHELWELSVVADAITTPFQAVRSSGLAAGDLAVCIGVGGIGIHGVQIAAAVGAKVIALDIDDDKLAVAAEYGADAVINTKGLDIREIKGRVKAAAKETNRIFADVSFVAKMDLGRYVHHYVLADGSPAPQKRKKQGKRCRLK